MRPRSLPVLIAGVLLLGGCGAAERPAGDRPPPDGAPSSVAPTVACPQQPGVELPPGCAAYDPDAAMRLNEQYRQRMPLEPEHAAEAGEIVAQVRADLERLGEHGGDETAVRAVLERAGLTAVQTRAAAGDVLFGAMPPGGGCVYGAVEAEAVTVDAGGVIMDGGCLPAQ
ncbi:hypothetical protein AB3M83_09880 [Microbacterium sp. 179-B 1A2 NHS]|uniref:hypothetical protein n=1 Tax=Microbacterium sp. 179-B 1A2 NHS TaxID=3142383 RepID=UPI0039A1E3E1